MLKPVLNDHLQELPCMQYTHCQNALKVSVYVILQTPYILITLQSTMPSCSRLMLCDTLCVLCSDYIAGARA